MFDVGFTEIFLIGVVSLIVIGPERLPAVAKTAGQWIAKLQRFVKGVKTDLASELDSGDLKKLIGDQREQIDELRSLVSSTKKDLQSTAQSVVKSTKEGLSELETSVNEAKSEVGKLDDSDVADVSSDAVKADKSKADVPKASMPDTDSSTSPDKIASEQSASSSRTGATDSDD